MRHFDCTRIQLMTTKLLLHFHIGECELQKCDGNLMISWIRRWGEPLTSNRKGTIWVSYLTLKKKKCSDENFRWKNTTRQRWCPLSSRGFKNSHDLLDSENKPDFYSLFCVCMCVNDTKKYRWIRSTNSIKRTNKGFCHNSIHPSERKPHQHILFACGNKTDL